MVKTGTPCRSLSFYFLPPRPPPRRPVQDSYRSNVAKSCDNTYWSNGRVGNINVADKRDCTMRRIIFTNAANAGGGKLESSTIRTTFQGHTRGTMTFTCLTWTPPTTTTVGVAKAWSRAEFAPPPATPEMGVNAILWTQHVDGETRPWLVTVTGVTTQVELNDRKGIHIWNRKGKCIVILDKLDALAEDKWISISADNLVYGYHGYESSAGEGGYGGNGGGAASVREGSGGGAAPTVAAEGEISQREFMAMALAANIVVTPAPVYLGDEEMAESKEDPSSPEEYGPYDGPSTLNSSRGEGYRRKRRQDTRFKAGIMRWSATARENEH